jgi:ATP-dependent RNA helicase DDX3X
MRMFCSCFAGKTAAFLLPFIAHLVINGRPAPAGGAGRNRRYMPVGLILAPTRELATQIWEESLKFTYLTSIHSVVVYGGQDIRQQFRELDRGW